MSFSSNPPLSPMSAVSGVFSTRDLSSIPGRQQRATATAYILLGVVNSTDQKLKRRFFTHGTRVFVNLWLLQKALL